MGLPPSFPARVFSEWSKMTPHTSLILSISRARHLARCFFNGFACTTADLCEAGVMDFCADTKSSLWILTASVSISSFSSLV